MKTTERFNKAYDALVKAFFEGTLAKGTCAACAVGNIVASGMGATVSKTFHCSKNNMFWKFIFCTDEGTQMKNFGLYKDREIQLTEFTGYSAEELALVEYAFETNTNYRYTNYYNIPESFILEDQFNGLCAVVDVLLKLDNITPEDHYKNKFREHPQLTQV